MLRLDVTTHARREVLRGTLQLLAFQFNHPPTPLAPGSSPRSASFMHRAVCVQPRLHVNPVTCERTLVEAGEKNSHVMQQNRFWKSYVLKFNLSVFLLNSLCTTYRQSLVDSIQITERSRLNGAQARLLMQTKPKSIVTISQRGEKDYRQCTNLEKNGLKG